MVEQSQPRVFISYCWSSEEHKQWVVDLATRLQTDGIEVKLDRWDLKDGHDKYAFMESMVNDKTISKVLVISDAEYARKANDRSGGVGTESQIISSEVYQSTTQEKFLPILRERDGDGVACLPTYMASRIYIDFSDDSKYEDSVDRLIRNLHNAPELKRPPLGKPPAHLFEKSTPPLLTAGMFQRFRDAVENGKSTSIIKMRDFLDCLGETLETVSITSPTDKSVPHDEIVMEAIRGSRAYRDQFVDFCLLAWDLPENQTFDQIHMFIERLIYMTNPDKLTSYSEWHLDQYRYIAYEWSVYFVATLIRARKFPLLVRYLDSSYLLRVCGDVIDCGFGRLNQYIGSLDEERNQRLAMRKFSLTAMEIWESAKHPKIKYSNLFESDLILAIRPWLLAPRRKPEWYPRLHIYGSQLGPLEIFVRALAPNGDHGIRDLFGCQDAREFARRVQHLVRDSEFRKFIIGDRFGFDFHIEKALNWDRLKSLAP